MARGFPDYQNPAYAIAARQVDFTDVITAILGFNTCDGRGRMMWVDRFGENLSAWALGKTGLGVNPAIDTTTSEIPPSAVTLDVGNGSGPGTSYMYHSFYLGETKRIGLEVSLFLSANVPNYQVALSVTIGDIVYTGTLSYTYADNAFRIATPTGSIDVWNAAPPPFVSAYTPVKFVIDLDTLTYYRFAYGNATVDLSEYDLESTPIGVVRINRVYLTAIAHAPLQYPGHIGHVLLTTDEP